MNAQHFRMYKSSWDERGLAKCLTVLNKNEFCRDTKEENMDSTDSALDEIVSSFLHECLPVCLSVRFSISVEFFFTYYVISLIK